jgi:hypothetical protein
VRVYCEDVKEAAALVATSLWSTDLQPYRHVGEVGESSKPLHWELSLKHFSRLTSQQTHAILLPQGTV